MKFLACLLLLCSTSAFGYFKKERLQVVRNYQNQSQLLINLNIPSYQQVCETEQVFGPDPMYCGYDTICYPLPNGGMNCTQQVRSCWHPERVCREVVDDPRAGRVRFVINFDPNARLAPGQTERFQVSYDYDRQTAYVLVRDSIYRYEQNDYGVSPVDLFDESVFNLNRRR